jgi:hypothetical protein
MKKMRFNKHLLIFSEHAIVRLMQVMACKWWFKSTENKKINGWRQMESPATIAGMER